MFIRHGLTFCTSLLANESVTPSLSILEIGFGTGLNAFLTLLKAQELGVDIIYTGVEAYPVSQEELRQLDYAQLINPNHRSDFELMHSCEWEKFNAINSRFSIHKQQKFFHDIDNVDEFNLIYFDAFGARVQPELWEEDIFDKMYTALKNNGILVTYSAKGSVRRAMEAVGFDVERLPGPPGKREMLRARKVL